MTIRSVRAMKALCFKFALAWVKARLLTLAAPNQPKHSFSLHCLLFPLFGIINNIRRAIISFLALVKALSDVLCSSLNAFDSSMIRLAETIFSLFSMVTRIPFF